MWPMVLDHGQWPGCLGCRACNLSAKSTIIQPAGIMSECTVGCLVAGPVPYVPQIRYGAAQRTGGFAQQARRFWGRRSSSTTRILSPPIIPDIFSAPLKAFICLRLIGLRSDNGSHIRLRLGGTLTRRRPVLDLDIAFAPIEQEMIIPRRADEPSIHRRSI